MPAGVTVDSSRGLGGHPHTRSSRRRHVRRSRSDRVWIGGRAGRSAERDSIAAADRRHRLRSDLDPDALPVAGPEHACGHSPTEARRDHTTAAEGRPSHTAQRLDSRPDAGTLADQ